MHVYNMIRNKRIMPGVLLAVMGGNNGKSTFGTGCNNNRGEFGYR